MALNDRLKLGHAWVICRECGAKLRDEDGFQDLFSNCPYVKGSNGACTDELKKY